MLITVSFLPITPRRGRPISQAELIAGLQPPGNSDLSRRPVWQVINPEQSIFMKFSKLEAKGQFSLSLWSPSCRAMTPALPEAIFLPWGECHIQWKSKKLSRKEQKGETGKETESRKHCLRPQIQVYPQADVPQIFLSYVNRLKISFSLKLV